MKRMLTEWHSEFRGLLDKPILTDRVRITVFVGFLAFVLVIRLITMQSPPIERTMWKEIDYITISKNYTENGFVFWRPEIEWPAEEPRVTAMELPLVPYVASLLYAVFGFSAYTVRILTALGFLLASVYVYRFAGREIGPEVGLIAGMLAAIMPLYHPFGSILFSEPWVIAFSVSSVFHFAEWVDRREAHDAFFAAAFFSLAVALKLTPLYMLIPLVWIAFRAYRFQWRRYLKPAAMLAGALVVPAAWYAYAYYLTHNSIDVFGIFGGHDKMQTAAMLSDPTWWQVMRWRVVALVFGGRAGALLAAAGLVAGLAALRKTNAVFAYLVAIHVYFVVVAEGQLDAPYRQLAGIPMGATFVSIGLFAAAGLVKVVLRRFGRATGRLGAVHYAPLALAGLYVAALVFDNRGAIFDAGPRAYLTDRVVELVPVINEHLSDGERIVTAGNYTIHKGGNDLSPVLYYYAGVQGWSLQRGQWDIQLVEDLKRKGAGLFVAMYMSREPESRPFIESVMNRYCVVLEDVERDYIVVDLDHRMCGCTS